MSSERKWRPATAVAHLGRHPKQHMGAVNTPVYRASTILFDSVPELEAAARGEHPGVVYGLHGMPTVTDLQSAFAALDRRPCRFLSSVSGGVPRRSSTST